jgi:hypothetical protein
MKLGVVDVSPFSRIRVVADERTGSAVPISIRLTITEGQEAVATLDTIALAARSSLTKVYEVPCKTLTINADAGSGTGSGAVDVLIYGCK